VATMTMPTTTTVTGTTVSRPTPATVMPATRPAPALTARERWENRLAALLAELGIEQDGLDEAVRAARRNPLLRQYGKVRGLLAPGASFIDWAEGLLTLKALERGVADGRRYGRTGTRAPARRGR